MTFSMLSLPRLSRWKTMFNILYMTFKTIHVAIEDSWWSYFNSFFYSSSTNTNIQNRIDVTKQLIQPLQLPAFLLSYFYYMGAFIHIVIKWCTIMIKQYRNNLRENPPPRNNVSLVRFMLNDVMYNVKLVDNKVVVIHYWKFCGTIFHGFAIVNWFGILQCRVRHASVKRCTCSSIYSFLYVRGHPYLSCMVDNKVFAFFVWQVYTEWFFYSFEQPFVKVCVQLIRMTPIVSSFHIINTFKSIKSRDVDMYTCGRVHKSLF